MSDDSDKLLLVAVRTDLPDVSMPVRNFLDAVGRHGGPPAHVAVKEIPEAVALRPFLAAIFAADNPDAFQTV